MTVAWDRTLLVGDVGGTNARFALAHMVEGRPVLEHHQSFPASEHPTFLGGVKAFLDGCDIKPTGGVLAVAGPVTDGEIDLTNSPWRVSEAELQDIFSELRRGKVVPLRETPLFATDGGDPLGLRALDESGRLFLRSAPGNHMHFSVDWFVREVVRPFLGDGDGGEEGKGGGAEGVGGREEAEAA